uniref:Uncharacterized protein LOC111117709 n=1 Tax=Crassostrea virginica TaxID=6565 RepID=A0A8B8CA08_CRAVI|nr:uncharacterized protein LOC111117709 [Crassostrea virginica]
MALNQAQDVSVVNYRIHKSFSLDRAEYIFDIAYLGNFFHRKPGIGISVASAYDDHQDVYSPDISVFTRGIFIEYNALSKTVLYGKDNAVYQTTSQGLPGPYQESNLVWTQGTTSGFSLKGIAVCKSGKALLSLWNNKIGERSVGKVIVINPGRPMEECVKIFTDKNLPLLVCPTYIAKNGNGDICVSDVEAVVVTDAGGMLRFRYQGVSRNSNFEPYGLCCDSNCNIIIADMKNDKIHVIDKDGGFLHYVRYEGIKMPRALSIDENDNVYVGEWNTTSIKVISR